MFRKITLILSTLLFSCTLTTTSLAESKNMTVAGVSKAAAGDIVEVPYYNVAKYCDFTQQIVRVPDGSEGAMYVCVYLGTARPGNLTRKLIKVKRIRTISTQKPTKKKGWLKTLFSKEKNQKQT